MAADWGVARRSWAALHGDPVHPYVGVVKQARGIDRGVTLVLAVAITLLAWIVSPRYSEVAFPTASLEGHQGSTIGSAMSLLVITSDRPRISVAPLRHGKALAISTSSSEGFEKEAPRWNGSALFAASSSFISIGPVGAGLTRRGPPAPLSS